MSNCLTIENIEADLKTSLKEVFDLKTALDAHAIVAITDPRGKITYVNDKFCIISKYAKEELLGQDHRIINSGYHSKSFFKDLWCTISHGTVWRGEIRNKAKDGSMYWVDTTIVPFLDEVGKPRQYVAIRADITARKQLEASVTHLASIVEHSEDAIISVNLQGIITSWNMGATKMLGHTATAKVGTSILQLIPGDKQAGEEAILAQLNQGKGFLQPDTIFLHKNETAVDVSVTTSSIKDETGMVIGGSKVIRNISEQKALTEKITKLNSELEQKVLERTAQLEDANKELEAFSYSISHDLRAPLRAINGFTHLLLASKTEAWDESALHFLDRIQAGGSHMSRLVDALLSFSRLSRQPLVRQTVNMLKLVQSVLSDAQPQLEARLVEINVMDLPCCQGDPVLLHQVWVNLISNAIKYTSGRNPAKIEIGFQTNPDTVVYFVQDNGAGFNMQYADKLFGVFQRLHRVDQFEGVGVGLAIVQRIIQRHGGRIWAKAEENQGATFCFTISYEL